MKIFHYRWFQWGIGLILILILVWLFRMDWFVFTPIIIFVKTLFLPFLLAGVLFYLCRPLVSLLELCRIPRPAAIFIIFLIMIGLGTIAVNLLVPVVQAQFSKLVDNIPSMIDTIKEGIAYWQENQSLLPDFVNQAIYSVGDKLEGVFTSAGSSITGFISSVVGVIFSLVVVPFILFYLLNDQEKFAPSVVRFFPKSRRDEIRRVLSDMDRALARYIQGQLLVSLCVGLILLIGYFIIGLHYALLLALFGMVMTLVPFLGAFISVIPAAIAGWFQDPIMVVYVVIVMVVAHVIESNLVSPQVMGRVLHIHPLTIILLVLVGSNLAGIVGMILIIPIYAVSKVIGQHIYQLFRIQD